MVTCIFAKKVFRRVQSGLSAFHSDQIVHYAGARIVDAPLKHILGHGNDTVGSIFAVKGS